MIQAILQHWSHVPADDDAGDADEVIASADDGESVGDIGLRPAHPTRVARPRLSVHLTQKTRSLGPGLTYVSLGGGGGI